MASQNFTVCHICMLESKQGSLSWPLLGIDLQNELNYDLHNDLHSILHNDLNIGLDNDSSNNLHN